MTRPTRLDTGKSRANFEGAKRRPAPRDELHSPTGMGCISTGLQQISRLAEFNRALFPMKIRIYLSFSAGSTPWHEVSAILASAGCAELVAKGENFVNHYGQYFDESDPGLKILRDSLAKRLDFRWSERVEHHYTEGESHAFPLLVLWANNSEIRPFGPSHGTTYDLSTGCAVCGCGATQTSPFLCPPSAFPKKADIAQSSTELFVSTRVADALRAGGTQGFELRQALGSKNHEPLPWWQIISRHEMPKFSDLTRGIIRGSPEPCATCRRDGHYHDGRIPEQIAYSRQSVNPDTLPDVVHTWECFAKSHIHPTDFSKCRIANPRILVKPNVLDIMRSLKVRHVYFAPVRIE